ncbi:glutamine-hydrolyzing carbamoyl-phosphate synthase small subunit [Salinicoccus halodurans]|uniref:Carbamoyl phosphate synthase small chain n=1 Tax=Salinicoccus halodurans TaxID=407035 RepID=A0A0F7HJ98_9STAP|nr:glutamine-hydrolyzing carbamoyl-phosphate synthase small subunit [Salinicoccus halodurans]AKG73721.1 carbamoyl phosphate synthase small subunit [Salinicoccus halodurans]SFK54807.1 carbamoyl-phosphate synthase small subunit [Salinicoccus halodurans]
MLTEKRYLVLEDGTVYEGYRFGGDRTAEGELVFNTSMTGAQEIITDLSYTDQIITFSYPLIGNTGVNTEDNETLLPSARGVVVREACSEPSNFRASESLDSFLKRHDIPGISGVDTRSITRKIRSGGVMKAVMTDEENHEELVELLQTASFRTDQVKRVSTKSPYISTGPGNRVVLIDYGKKENIVRSLNALGCDVTVVPYNTSAADILRMRPDGVMLSNGPGNPEDVEAGIKTVKNLIGKVPLFGICLGHQLIGLACGAKTFKMKFGHRGSNHPVMNLKTTKVEITAQNHGFAIDGDSLASTGLEITHTALNDKTVEGIRHVKHPVFSVQYHPEASAGPHDSEYLFGEFVKMMEIEKEANNA